MPPKQKPSRSPADIANEILDTNVSFRNSFSDCARDMANHALAFLEDQPSLMRNTEELNNLTFQLNKIARGKNLSFSEKQEFKSALVTLENLAAYIQDLAGEMGDPGTQDIKIISRLLNKPIEHVHEREKAVGKDAEALFVEQASSIRTKVAPLITELGRTLGIQLTPSELGHGQ